LYESGGRQQALGMQIKPWTPKALASPATTDALST
jgi:hypothetical protein